VLSRPPRGRPAVAAGAMLTVAIGWLACEPTNQGYAPPQPIVYSHAVHAGANEIPCQYCHFTAERSRHAGIPPTSVCMGCHEHAVKDHPEVMKLKEAFDAGTPIAWVRVHQLPDHTFFDHSVHVSADVACQTCHGPIQSMGRVEQFAPLTMGWCVDCHRQKGRVATGPEAKHSDRANRLTDCSVCHH